MNLKIIGGSSHKEFTKKICDRLGVTETKTSSKIFSNDNRFITIDDPVRGADVFFIQSSVPPVDGHVMETLMFIRALKSASASRITAVLPYFPYIRSDKKDQPRICITAKLLADLLEKAGADRVVIMEMHSPQMQGFFSVPCDHLIAAPDIVHYLKQNWNLENYVIVAGDSGATKLIEPFADSLNLPVAMMNKRRIGNEEKVKIKGVIGDVTNKKVLIIDDETLSGRTLIEDTNFLLDQAGAKSVDVCFIHANLGENASERLNHSRIGRFITTDTIPSERHGLRNVEIVSVAKRFAETIRRIHNNESIKSVNDIG